MKRLHNFIFSIGLLFLVSSCVDELPEINESPNSATDAPLDALVVASQVSLMGVYESEDARLANMWTRQFTGSDRQYTSYHTYIVTSEVFSFIQVYIGVIQPTLDAEVKAAALNNRAVIGMLKVIRAMAYGHAVALYGDIPFTESNQYPEIENPEYDGQEAVYARLQIMLDEAIADLNSGEGGIAGSIDIFYNGDNSSWVELANTVKARYYLHVGDYTAALNSANNGISSPAGNMLAPHGTTVSANQNSYYDFAVIQRDGYLTAEDSYLARLIDPTQPEYRGDTKTDDSTRFATIFNGGVGEYVLNTTADGYFAADASFPLASFAETQLIKAESILRDNPSDLQAAIDELNALRGALESTYPGSTYDDYVIADFQISGIANNDGSSAVDALLTEIIEEKYVSLVGQVEVFNDFRRLDNPLGLTPTIGTRFPQRFLYPTDEVNSNSNFPSTNPGLFDATPINQ